MVRQNGDYQAVLSDPNPANPYYQEDWFSVLKLLKPESCIWNHVRASQTKGELAMSCGVAIERDNQFWGASTVNFTLNQLQENIVKLSESSAKAQAQVIFYCSITVTKLSPPLILSA